ncbi:Retrovirus-related Pol polyprotein from transposon 17.6 [Stylophora pistillata]|uniref:Retrovirus-related Pol polyprotein from transposon 17.6 n=1 Tax=Stylophora pistillata TaxID=50429 RepID=A0A2B4SF90_STYPI|nr:Retrovirus-related Pol polyprotein from transposon 17.6 [Stylophora pistillata]
MNTPFGRYRWLRMPFGINSAPEVWQQRMHELVEGLTESQGFPQSRKRKKPHSQQREFETSTVTSSFIGHLTAEGLEPEVQAIVDYPVPTNLAELRTILGTVQYLVKFCQHLSTASQPLRQLEKKEIEWHYQHPQDKAFKEIKEFITKAPVLQYFDVSKNVTIQCDASQYGIGATLLQEGQPVHYANRALTSTEQNYAQIEKELLAVVFSCVRFEHYIHAKHVAVETDYKPLIAIQKKPINTASKRLQRMMLRL